MASWFIVRGEKEQGPLTAAQLKEMAATGKLRPEDLVRREDLETPRQASVVKGLFSEVAPAAQPSTPPPKASPKTKKDRPAPPPSALPHPQNRVQITDATGTLLSPPTGDAEKAKKAAAKKVGVILSVVGGACLFLCCGGFGLIGMFGMRMEQNTRKQLAEAEKAVTVKHDRYTQVIMPELPPERVHDKEKGEPERDSGEVVVPDISKVDFLHGPNGEPVEMVKYFEISKVEGGPEKKVWRRYGYLYRNKAGKNVYHGPWCFLFNGDKNKKEFETVYVHGAMKFMQSWDRKGKPLSLEIFKSDNEHTQAVYEYFDSGKDQFFGQFVKVRYVPNENGHRVERVPNGMHFHYWEQNGRVRQEEAYEDGQQIGIAIYDLWGKKVLGRGELGS